MTSIHTHFWDPWFKNLNHSPNDQSSKTSYGIIAFSTNIACDERQFWSRRTYFDRKSIHHRCLMNPLPLFKKAIEPDQITSTNVVNINVLLVQKRATNAFRDLLAGRFSTSANAVDRHQLITLLSELTCDERWRILNGDFDHSAHSTLAQHRQELCSTLAMLFPYFFHYRSREFEFPKGRRERETNLMCALREFSEETGYKTSQVHLVSSETTLKEIFIGSDGHQYCHIYYIALIDAPLNVARIERQHNAEIKSVGWYTLPTAHRLLQQRQYEKTKLTLLAEAYNIVRNAL